MKRQRKLKGDKANYRELAKCALPRSISSRKKRKLKSKAGLYPIEIVETDSEDRVKVHYIGYSDTFDEWKDLSEIEDITTEVPSPQDQQTYAPYSLYHDLSIRIKRSLTCARSSPDVKIVMPFDALTFNGGLKSVGMPCKKIGGIQHYKIKAYEDLNVLLGCNWHVRGININGDYGYVIKDTVEFYFRKCRDLIDFIPPSPSSSNVQSIHIDTGHSLTFTFTTGYGNLATFGKDKTIFCDI